MAVAVQRWLSWQPIAGQSCEVGTRVSQSVPKWDEESRKVEEGSEESLLLVCSQCCCVSLYLLCYDAVLTPDPTVTVFLITYRYTNGTGSRHRCLLAHSFIP